MKKIILFCHSIHHKNTLKIANAVCTSCHAELVELPCTEPVDLNQYDLIGFASGIYMSDFGKPLYDFANQLKGLEGKACFTVYTSGASFDKLDQKFIHLLEEKGAHTAHRFNCRGFDTFGPFNLVGGLQKGHPDESDLESAARFGRHLLSE